MIAVSYTRGRGLLTFAAPPFGQLCPSIESSDRSAMADVPTLYEWLGGMPALESLAVMNSQPGAAAVEDAPMPRWGWGEVGGPYQPPT